MTSALLPRTHTPAFALAGRSAGDIHQRHLTPALFQQWTDRVLNAADLQPDMRVADIACGTGVLTHAAIALVGKNGLVAGIEANKDFLEVARSSSPTVPRTRPSIVWQHAQPQKLPFADGSFDAVVCQFGLMFFEDRAAALREMYRILRPGGRMVLTVWDSVELSPGFSAEQRLLHRVCGPEVAAESTVAFSLGEPLLLRALFRQAGIPRIAISTCDGTARFPSIRFWIYARIKGSTLATRIQHAQFTELLVQADQELARFAAADGTVAFATPAHLIVVNKS